MTESSMARCILVGRLDKTTALFYEAISHQSESVVSRLCPSTFSSPVMYMLNLKTDGPGCDFNRRLRRQSENNVIG